MRDERFVLITGSGRRVGRSFALYLAEKGFNIALHYNTSEKEAESVALEIEKLGRKVILIKANLIDEDEVKTIVPTLLKQGKLGSLINNAAIFEKADWQQTNVEIWNRHLAINLTAPFLLSQAFANSLTSSERGKIVNILDWKIERTNPTHLPYIVSKNALASLTKELALSLANRVEVNGIALGAVLPPVDGSANSNLIDEIPLKRWATLNEVNETLLFLLTGPSYITGEIIKVDGGRHLI